MNYQVNQQEIFSVVVDGSKISTTAIEVATIPANTVVTGVVYEEVEKVDASKAITLKAKTAHADSGSFTGFTTGSGTTCVNGYNPAVTTSYYAASTSGGAVTTAVSVPGTFFTKAGDVLTVAGPSTLTTGKLRIGLVGFRTGMTAAYSSAGDNKAPVDPYTPPEKK